MSDRNVLLLATLTICLQFVYLTSAQRTPTDSTVNFCRTNKGKVVAHETLCDYYYECQGSEEPLLKACPNGLAFAGFQRGLSGHCDYPHRVSCPDGTRVMGQQPVVTENCPWQYGVFPHATSCTRYWQCWNGTSTIQQCPFSLLYNNDIHACDWPDNVPDCQKHPICKDTSNGLVFIEKSCVRYWLCVGGYPRLQRCPAGLAVNPVTSKCELASTVPGCEPPPTTATPEEETGTSPSPITGLSSSLSSSSSASDSNQGGNPSSIINQIVSRSGARPSSPIRG